MSKSYQRWLFRLLVVVSCLFPFLADQIDSRFNNLLPDKLFEYLYKNQDTFYGIRWSLESAADLVYIVVGVISVIGLLVFWKPARWIYVAFVAYGLFSTLYMGPMVASAVKSTAADLINVMQGMLLILIFTPPVKNLFEQKKAPN